MTPNSEQLVNLTYSKAYRELYKVSTDYFCDSSFLSFYYSFLKKDKIKRITGVDIISFFLEHYRDKIFIVGGSEKVENYLGKEICESKWIDFGNQVDINFIIRRIKYCKKTHIFISIGSPRAELLVNILKPHFPEKNFYCVGNGVNFSLGIESRPKMKITIPGYEAIYRTFKYPKIFFRSLSTLRIFFCLTKFNMTK
jgi:UDP-N-acetyl-D-mannosaminuronic acid transferase (WecB/TagA/CpsF family)